MKNSQHMHCIKGDIFYNSDHFFSFYKQIEKQGLSQKPGIDMMLKIMLETKKKLKAHGLKKQFERSSFITREGKF